MEDKEKEVEIVANENNNIEKKDNKILKYFLLVILVAAICGGIFFLGNTFMSEKEDEYEETDSVSNDLNQEENVIDTEEETTTDTDNEAEVEDNNVSEKIQGDKLTKDSAVVKKLFSVYTEVEDGAYGVSDNHDYDSLDAKKSLAALALKREGKDVIRNCSNLSASYTTDGFFCDPYDIVYDVNGEIDYFKYSSKVENSKVTTYNVTELKAKYFELFGKNAEYKEGGFYLTNYPNAYAYYDSANSLYAHFGGGGGGISVGATQTLDSIEQSGSTLKLITTIKLDDESKTKLTVIYTFEYEKETGNYIFVSREEK